MPDGTKIQERDINTIPSTRRNPVLADIFGRLGYMERQGSGLNKICEAYENAASYKEGMGPEFYSYRVLFMVTLKNLNYKLLLSEAEKIVLTELEKVVCELLKENPRITQSEIQKLLNLSRSKVQRTMKKLVSGGVIENTGSHRIGYWKVKNSQKI
ncbi:MAG TPA: cell filamentation protein Fic [Lachnospiraceae bacterium]|nr:cell filamentation protein Fic [Lachnospiraceae bacterium]